MKTDTDKTSWGLRHLHSGHVSNAIKAVLPTVYYVRPRSTVLSTTVHRNSHVLVQALYSLASSRAQSNLRLYSTSQ